MLGCIASKSVARRLPGPPVCRSNPFASHSCCVRAPDPAIRGSLGRRGEDPTQPRAAEALRCSALPESGNGAEGHAGTRIFRTALTAIGPHGCNRRPSSQDVNGYPQRMGATPAILPAYDHLEAALGIAQGGREPMRRRWRTRSPRSRRGVCAGGTGNRSSDSAALCHVADSWHRGRDWSLYKHKRATLGWAIGSTDKDAPAQWRGVSAAAHDLNRVGRVSVTGARARRSIA